MRHVRENAAGNSRAQEKGSTWVALDVVTKGASLDKIEFESAERRRLPLWHYLIEINTGWKYRVRGAREGVAIRGPFAIRYWVSTCRPRELLAALEQPPA